MDGEQIRGDRACQKAGGGDRRPAKILLAYNRKMLRGTKFFLAASLTIAFAQLSPAAWVNLLNGKNIEGWEVVGEGFWNAMNDGTLVGQRDPAKATDRQCWLYTKKEFGEYDLHVEYWLRWGGNSGVSIRDRSRAQFAQGAKWDPKRTPSHIGYEIQI